MGRWHSIVQRKTAGDQNKGKAYARVGKLITIAAKKGADPDLNPSLALALEKAKENNLPKEVVDRAIKKGSGQGDGEELYEIAYEGYGPGGVALLIQAITSNTNRSATSVKVIVQKHGGNMGEIGSVGRQFKHLGVIVIDGIARKNMEKGKEVLHVDPYNPDAIEEDVLSLDVEDIDFEDGKCIVTTSKENYHEVYSSLLIQGYHVVSSDLQYIPDNTVDITDEQKDMLLKMLDAFDDDDDVDSVAHNANL